MNRTNGSANGRPPAQPHPARSSNAQATPEHAQATPKRDGVLTGKCRVLTKQRLGAALADPALKPSTLEVAPGVPYRRRGVTANLARQVRDAIEDTLLDHYQVTDATAVHSWATAHLIADLSREVLSTRLGRALTPEEAALTSLKASGLYGRVAYAVRYLAHATGAYAYRPGIADRPARLAYSPAVIEEARARVPRGSRGGSDTPRSHGGVIPRGVTRSTSVSDKKSPAIRSSERERSPAQATTVTTSTSRAPTPEARRTVTSTVLEAWYAAITRDLDGLKALRLLDAEGWREDADLRRAVAAIATRANGHDPARVIGRLGLKGDRNLEGDGWRTPTLTGRLASLLGGTAGRDAIAVVVAADLDRARTAAEADAREAHALAAEATATPMPADLRAAIGARRGHSTPVLEVAAIPPVTPVTPEAPGRRRTLAPPHASPVLARRTALEEVARDRDLTASELTELERLTLATIGAGLTAERTPAYLLDPPHRDRVIEHAVAPSPVLERAQALAAFAHLLDTRRRHGGAAPGDAVLASLERRLGRLLTLSELDLLDALPATITADLDALNAWASGERVLTASTGRP